MVQFDKLEITLSDVGQFVRSGEQVLILMRHAQRPRILPSEPDKGDLVPLTPHGVIQAYQVGKALAEFHNCVQFLSSPLLRARMSCSAIREGMGISQDESEIAYGRNGWDWMRVDDRLGEKCFFVADKSILRERYARESFASVMERYFRTGSGQGFNELSISADKLEGWVLQVLKKQVGLFITHDWFCAAFLCARLGIQEWTKQNWIHFCDGATIVCHPDGRRMYFLLRNEQ